MARNIPAPAWVDVRNETGEEGYFEYAMDGGQFAVVMRRRNRSYTFVWDRRPGDAETVYDGIAHALWMIGSGGWPEYVTGEAGRHMFINESAWAPAVLS